MLAIGRALMARPRLLLLDEPSLGLAPKLVETIFEVIREINAQSITILLVEQNAQRAFAIADRAHVMSGGTFGLVGTPAELVASAGFDAAYFGVEMRDASIAP